MKRTYPSPDRIRELLSYDPEAGDLIWRVRRGKILAGSRAGRIASNGYVQISIDYHKISAHRLAWAIAYGEWPQSEIDHINGDRADNRLVNLRAATRTQNMANLGKSKRNTSGYKNVGLHRGRWRADARVNGKYVYFGKFDTPEEAHAAYVAGVERAMGEFARVQ